MRAPNKIYVEVCEDGIFAFPKPPFRESVEYIRADLVEQPLQQEQPEVGLSEEALREGFRAIDHRCYIEGSVGWQREKLIAHHFYNLGLNAKKE